MFQLAVFLGNPGSEYESSRHNAGWMLADAVPEVLPAVAFNWQKKYQGLYACMDSARLCAADNLPEDVPGKLHVLKPQTYMNLSGESARAAAAFFKIKLDEIMVIHDEIELPLGTLSLKFSGGLGGHNGLRSMKACFGGADFWRLRIGIGRPDGRIPGKGGNRESSQNAGIADWVLSGFSAAEIEALAPVFKTGAELLLRAFMNGPERLLPEWAKKNCLT